MEYQIPIAVAQIEMRVNELRQQIRELEQQIEETLRSDEEYAAYLDSYYEYYQDEPLSIGAYYRNMAELEAVNAEIMAASAEEMEAVWARYGRRLAHLERVLAA